MADQLIQKCSLHSTAVMADNGRLRQSGKAYKDFVYLMEAHRGEVRAVVTAAEVMIIVRVDNFCLFVASKVSIVPVPHLKAFHA